MNSSVGQAPPAAGVQKLGKQKSPPDWDMAAVNVRSVTHWFPTADGPQLALRGIDLEVPAGQFVCLVGPSGCGKTTLLNIISGQIANELGTVELIDQNRQKMPKNSIGYMFARDALIPWRSLRRNVEFGLELRNVKRAVRRARAAEMLDLVGLPNKGELYPRQLSHGMRQRASLARTLSIDPELLLVDEPFGALDAQTKMRLQKEFLGIWERTRKTVVFVTHDLNEACLLADRIVVMRDGRIAKDLLIDFPRPRDLDSLRFEPKFQELVKSLWSLISGEE